MKVCFYSVTATVTLGGLETYIWELGRELDSRGHEVVVVAGEGGQSRSESIRLVQFPYTPRDQFPRFPNLRRGFRQRYRKLAERLSFASATRPYLEQGNFDVIVVTKPYDFPVIWSARRRGMKTRTVFSSGGKDFFIGDRFFADAVDCWISCSRSNAVDIDTRYRCHSEVVPYGVDVTSFKPTIRNSGWRNHHGIPEDAPLLMSVGRLVHWKGIQVVIRAIANVPTGHLAIVGDGPYRSQLKQLAQSLGITERVHFIGRVQHSELPEAFTSADIFTQPSIGNEAFGITLIEAMASGLPTLGANRGGIAEVIVDERTGFVLPPGDVGAWRDAIAKLAGDPDLRTCLGAAARERAENEFSWLRAADRFEAIVGFRNTSA